MTLAAPPVARPVPSGTAQAAGLPESALLTHLGTSADLGLTGTEAVRRRLRDGPNAVASHRARWWPVLWHQLRSPLLGLLTVAAAASFVVGERSDALIIGVIVGLTVGLGFANEYRAEKAAQALHSSIRHDTVVTRDGRPQRVDVTDLVTGDLVDLHLGDVVPADVRLLAVAGLTCDEAVMTGEASPVEKSVGPSAAGTPLADLAGCALMGTVVHGGSARGVVVATGPRTEFGAIAAGLGTRQLETVFQSGLRRFSMLLVTVAGGLTGAIFVVNLVLHVPCWSRCCSRWPSPSASPPSCCRPWCPAVWPPDPPGWPGARCW